MNYREFMMRLGNQPMELHEEWRSSLEMLATSHSPNDEIDPQAIAEALNLSAPVKVNPRAAGSIAIVPLRGFMQPREDIWTRMGFATSTEAFARNVRAAVQDPNVKAVLFDVDSGGGFVSGVPEACDAIHKLRGQTPMVAVSNMMMASAAYHVASSADEIVTPPSSLTGSIGVWTVVFDEMKAWEMLGIEPFMVKAGKFKALGNGYEPVTEEVVSRLQERVDRDYGRFVEHIARNRGAKAADVRNGFGQGDVCDGKESVSNGLSDRMATFEETLARFGAPPPSSDAGTSRAARIAELQRDVVAARYGY